MRHLKKTNALKEVLNWNNMKNLRPSKGLKNILEIFKSDLKDIRGNYAVLIIVVGLAFLPSLYAWFNIKASWDPYGSTANMLVAVTNEDKGNEIAGQKINIGDQLIEQLKDNKSLGWQFVDEKTALEGVKKGTYYASLKIPKNFTKDLTSLITDDVKKGELIYTVNEKINAVAPKITDKGASAIQLQVNQTIIKTVSEIVLGVSNGVGAGIEHGLPKLTKVESSLIDLQKRFDHINKTVDLAADATSKLSGTVKDIKADLPTIKKTLNDTKLLSSDVKKFLEDTNNNVDELSPLIKSDLNLMVDLSSSASSLTLNLIDAVNSGSEDVPKLIDNLSEKLSNLQSLNDTLEDFLTKLNQLTSNNRLDDVINSLEDSSNKIDSSISTLNDIKDKVISGQQPSISALNNVLSLSNGIGRINLNILNNFDSKISKPINSIFEKSINVANDIITVLDKAEAKLPKVEEILTTSLSLSGNAQESISLIREKLPLAKGMLDDLVDTLSKISNGEDMKKLVNLLESDILTKSNFLKEPVEVKTEKLYPIANYGSAMTPFYSVLSTWVGILLLSALLSTSVHGNYKPYEIYFGRGLTFLSIALVQGFIIGTGDILLLGVTAEHPILLIILLMFTSMVFNFIVYSLVSVFGNIGKAIAIVLLVVQIGSSGGTFPIQVTPTFFQRINPIMPFTYAIGATREAVGGIYPPNLIKDILVLLLFMILFICLNVLLKGPINRVIKPFNKKFGDSNLTGH
ncbi:MULTISPECIES: YhgE/Pip domain-containing protein [unclassified Clostridioides]|uniref:YhgE/Pip domain-containing protein n=1 Tax=unclassified Clostridioides TaxID=2635829 RepID=UPI001D11819B|nr:YhgE/Pip domain-containing protein [Clostridioides sp. ZZV14-6150]MCC0659524.1 YhgE/Pip domain-containing protein [Clostridioides sp. ZZV14-6154]MCC0666965.1 YhgE/Pip domain-containing protein [Clostridioides sp. ZZV14-6153]MCC0723745.1 YhgE/Pip domain-containing protein [Clostridioides sp. ZZV14-6104]MCC0742212.1 YhgE/Pip domain-containing protein [Clostridioides sp. ZZV14-6044]MCC0752164.1 YhgE/Pip domain-containing protein [Clostridioides sp. ZZV13-5731]